jgi:hypothetical protein
MRNKLIAIVLALQLGSAHAAVAPAVVAPDWAERSAPARADIVKRSVREALAEHDEEARQHAEPIRRHENDTLRGDAHDVFDQRMEEARVPGCLRPDGLKNQPTSIGPFGLAGLLALPMVAVAALRGKCN